VIRFVEVDVSVLHHSLEVGIEPKVRDDEIGEIYSPNYQQEQQPVRAKPPKVGKRYHTEQQAQHKHFRKIVLCAQRDESQFFGYFELTAFHAVEFVEPIPNKTEIGAGKFVLAVVPPATVHIRAFQVFLYGIIQVLGKLFCAQRGVYLEFGAVM
jgi:hypothetical protein